MATRSEAKLALWQASAKDDAARAFIVQFLKEHSQDRPGGYVDPTELAQAVRGIAHKPSSTKKAKGDK